MESLMVKIPTHKDHHKGVEDTQVTGMNIHYDPITPVVFVCVENTTNDPPGGKTKFQKIVALIQ
jgi:hypothetical protein